MEPTGKHEFVRTNTSMRDASEWQCKHCRQRGVTYWRRNVPHDEQLIANGVSEICPGPKPK